MLGYIVPAFLILATLVGTQLAFQHLWLSLLLAAIVALVLPYGDLHGKPLIVNVVGLPFRGRKARRRRWRRHRYYSA